MLRKVLANIDFTNATTALQRNPKAAKIRGVLPQVDRSLLFRQEVTVITLRTAPIVPSMYRSSRRSLMRRLGPITFAGVLSLAFWPASLKADPPQAQGEAPVQTVSQTELGPKPAP